MSADIDWLHHEFIEVSDEGTTVCRPVWPLRVRSIVAHIALVAW